MRLMILAVSAAVLALAACEKAEDKAASLSGAKFDVEFCANGSVDAPTHMTPTACVASPNKAYVLVMQPSGELALATVAGGRMDKMVWTSETRAAEDAAAADLQEDGNLVIYKNQKPIWDSHTAGPPGRYNLSVTDQGNVIIKNPDGQPIWAAQFDLRLCRPNLTSPAQMAVGGCVLSPGKAFVMTVQKTGALEVLPVQADGALGQPIWSSGNHLSGRSAAPFLALQTDGNLVLYVAGKPAWNSKTNGAEGSFKLDLTDDGDLQLHRADGKLLWSSKASKAKV